MKAKGHKGPGMEGFIARQYDKNAGNLQEDMYREYAADTKNTLKKKI